VAAPISHAKQPYNPVTDFQWVAVLSNAPFVIAVNPSLPVKNLRELVAYCKERPGKLNYGHAGRGTTVHLAGELLNDRAGIEVPDVPYPGSAPAITDTIAGNVQYVIETSGTLLPYHKAGKLRIISVMAETREKISAEVPTSKEEGFDLIAGTYNLLAMPLGSSPALLEQIAKATNRVMNKTSTIERLSGLGITPITKSSPDQARSFLTNEVERWSAVVKKLGIAL
jgi:tripartite-type tricarboxylate transporter receptor subunit TctC